MVYKRYELSYIDMGCVMRIVKIILVTCLTFINFITQAKNEVSQKVKGDVFKSCRTSCIQYPQALPNHIKYSEMPFVFESYCSCYCTRQALTLSFDDIILAGRLQAEGKSLESDKRIREMMQLNATACIRVMSE